MTKLIKYANEYEILSELCLSVDTSGWDKQNEEDYKNGPKRVDLKELNKKFVFNYSEIEDGQEKNYEVTYKLIGNKGYVPCVKKTITKEDGQAEKCFVQIGRFLFPLEYDAYLLRKSEIELLGEQKGKAVKSDNNLPNM